MPVCYTDFLTALELPETPECVCRCVCVRGVSGWGLREVMLG